MNKADLYRAKADECRQMAAKVSTPHDQREWLQLASAWLQLIPESPPTAADCFDSMERVWGTRPTEIFRRALAPAEIRRTLRAFFGPSV
jgi:hypothetical protein